MYYIIDASTVTLSFVEFATQQKPNLISKSDLNKAKTMTNLISNFYYWYFVD